MPIFYECQRCTACCRWPGEVRLSEPEIQRIANYLGLTEHEFIQRFTQLNQDRSGLALLDQATGACIFLDGNDCRVQPVKPQQCREFPNLWNFAGFEQICRAIPTVLDQEEYQERLRASLAGRRT